MRRILSYAAACYSVISLAACVSASNDSGASRQSLLPSIATSELVLPKTDEGAALTADVARRRNDAGNVQPTAQQYPVYSSYFVGDTPFHHTVVELMNAGAVILSGTVAEHYWAQGIELLRPGSETGSVGPLYFVNVHDNGYSFSCPAYGQCNASGLTVHYPAGAKPEAGSDHHLNSFDPIFLHGEVDAWGGDGNPHQACNITSGNPGTVTCSWGGFFPFNGNGLATPGYSSGNAGGYANGLMVVTAQEVLNGRINHALGLAQSCEDPGGVYPSIVGRSTDSSCPTNLEPNAVYGDLIHIKASINIKSLSYSPYCQVIVQALQDYGGYTAENNGGYGIALNVEQMNDFSNSSNPWYNTIFPAMVKGGDGTGYGANFRFDSCLQRIPASAIEIIKIKS